MTSLNQLSILKDETLFPSWELVRDALNNWTVQAKYVSNILCTTIALLKYNLDSPFGKSA